MDIEDFRKLCHDETIAITSHAQKRLFERNITLDDIENAILSGMIIKEYLDDKPFPSCLILGYAENGNPLHIVASTDDEYLYIITTYWPDPNQWMDNFTKRRETSV